MTARSRWGGVVVESIPVRGRRQRRSFQAPALSCVLAVALALAGCSLIRSPGRTYLTNRDLLEATATGLGFEVDPDQFTLAAIDIRDDVITLQYTGKARPGDQAWVLRFSEKSTEQDRVGLSDSYSLLEVLSEGRRNFAVVEDGERGFAGSVARFVRYTFDSHVRSETGSAFVGRGILATLRRESEGDALVYQIKLDNYGDRDALEFEDLAPLLAPLAGEK